MSPRSEGLARAGLAAGSALLATVLGLAIVATYVAGATPPLAHGRPNVELQDFVRDADLGWRPPPLLRWKVRPHPGAPAVTFFATNRHGFRADEPEWPPRGEVMVLGDSFVQGYFLSQEETIPAALARRVGGHVYNLGVGGYSTDQEYTLLTQVLPRARARHLVVVFCINDLPYLDRDSAWEVAKPVYRIREGLVSFDELVPTPTDEMARPVLPEPSVGAPGATLDRCCFAEDAGPLPARAARRLRGYLADLARPQALLQNVREDVRWTRRPHYAYQLSEDSYRSPRALDRKWDLAFQFLRRIRDVAHAHGATTTVYFVPEVAQIAGATPGPFLPQARFRELCAASSLRCVEPADEFLAEHGRRPLFFADDGHLSPAGAELAAAQIAREITR